LIACDVARFYLGYPAAHACKGDSEGAGCKRCR
jgi:hypothetical protein